MKIADPRTLTSLDEIRNAKMVFYSAQTCWWTTNPDHLYGEPGGIPLDPSGSPLFQDDDVEGWLHDAEKHAVDRYGKHGIEALILAYHGNVVTESAWDSLDEQPVCSTNWDSYNDLLDEAQ